MKNLVKEKMQAGERTLGSFLETGSATAVECLGLGGLDYVIIDNEHGPYNPQSTLEFVRAAKLYGMTPFARVSEISREAVLRQLDVGVMGLVIPDVRRVDEVERIVEYGKYLPLGKRGVAPTAGSASGMRTMPGRAWSTISRSRTARRCCCRSARRWNA